jgi:propionyl-CoA synthetase
MIEKLPKTRSGKILRHCIKKLVDGEEITKIPPTIEDATTLTKIETIIK